MALSSDALSPDTAKAGCLDHIQIKLYTELNAAD